MEGGRIARSSGLCNWGRARRLLVKPQDRAGQDRTGQDRNGIKYSAVAEWQCGVMESEPDVEVDYWGGQKQCSSSSSNENEECLMNGICVWSKPILPKPDGVIASQQAAWNSGFKQATACEPGRCDSGFETDWRPCASGPDKEGVRLARAMLRSSPCHGSHGRHQSRSSIKHTTRARARGRERPATSGQREMRQRRRVVNSGEADQCPPPAYMPGAHCSQRERSHGLWLCASTAPCRPAAPTPAGR